jgi:hypothetical protein
MGGKGARRERQFAETTIQKSGDYRAKIKLFVIPRESGVSSNHRQTRKSAAVEYWIIRFRG